VVGQRGAKRGVRLVDRRSLMAHIEAGQEPACEQGANAIPSATFTPVIQRQTKPSRVQTFRIAGKIRKAG